MKRQALKVKQVYSFCTSAKCHKRFSKINNSVKYYLQKCTIYYPYMIQYTITRDYIIVKLDDGNGGA